MPPLPLLHGLIFGAGLCLTVGPQSLFIVRQGIRGNAPFLAALICVLVDFALIWAAVAGAHSIVAWLPEVERFAVWGAAVFMVSCACPVILAAIRTPVGAAAIGIPAGQTVASVAAMALALSLLNPQVYLEVLLGVGIVGLHFADGERWLFGLGVALISPVWFFGLALGGRRLARAFAQPGLARAFDGVSGVIMIALAAAILRAGLAGP
jgi:L-lysine exporter family protein LysE/ArgO